MSTHVEERVPQLSAGPRRAYRPLGMSLPEIFAAALALVALAAAMSYYFTALGPEKARLRAQQQELQRIQGESSPQSNEAGGPRGPNVKDSLASLQSFRSEYLKPLGSGRIALINEVNALAKKHNVVLTSGIDMPLSKAGHGDAKAAKNDGADKKGK